MRLMCQFSSKFYRYSKRLEALFLTIARTEEDGGSMLMMMRVLVRLKCSLHRSFSPSESWSGPASFSMSARDCPYMPGRLEVNWRLQNNLKQLMRPGQSSPPPTTLRTLGPVPLTFTGSFAVAPCFSSAFFSACSSCLRTSQSLKVYQKFESRSLERNLYFIHII